MSSRRQNSGRQNSALTVEWGLRCGMNGISSQHGLEQTALLKNTAAVDRIFRFVFSSRLRFLGLYYNNVPVLSETAPIYYLEDKNGSRKGYKREFSGRSPEQ